MVICLERGADLHTAQMMSLPFTDGLQSVQDAHFHQTVSTGSV